MWRMGGGLRGAHIQFAIYPGMDLSHYLAERERWEWDALEITQ